MLVFFGIFLKVSVQDHITKCSLQNLTNFYGVGLKPVYSGVCRKRVGGNKSLTTFFPIPADWNRISVYVLNQDQDQEFQSLVMGHICEKHLLYQAKKTLGVLVKTPRPRLLEKRDDKTKTRQDH